MILYGILKGLFKPFLNSPYFHVGFIFLGGMILKMKKFVIQWRKFE